MQYPVRHRNWKDFDYEFLGDKVEEFGLDPDEVMDELDIMGFNDRDINSHIYAVYYIASSDFIEKLKDFMDKNNYDMEVVEEGILEDKLQVIYTNYLDSGFDSPLSRYDISEPDEDMFKEVLEDIDIYPKEKKLEVDL